MKGKRVIVTGGSRGIGAACVRLFAREGADVVFIYKNSRQRAEALCDETGARAVCGDLSDPAGCAAAIAEALGLLGGCDVLVNNAGAAHFELIDRVTDEDWQKYMEINLGCAFRCCRAAAPGMIAQKSGAIVNVSSMWGETGSSCESLYSTAKAGVIGLTKSLARELGPSGIRVNCVSPGFIDTEMNAALDDSVARDIAAATPLCRVGRAEEIAACVRFLASDEASFVTGAVLDANGGYLC